MTSKKVDELRELMHENNVDAYMIFMSDYHGSEYVSEHFKAIEYITGFTGSAATLVITDEEAGLWTDGRYFLQAEGQLRGSGVKLYREGEAGIPTPEEFLAQRKNSIYRIGFDGRTVNARQAENLKKAFDRKIVFVTDVDIVDEIWPQRPVLVQNPIKLLSEENTGESRQCKLERLRGELSKKKMDMTIISSLDDLAWLFNIRGSDIEYNPLALAYGIISQDKALLFVGAKAADEATKKALMAEGVEIKDYEVFLQSVQSETDNRRILADESQISLAIKEAIAPNAYIVWGDNPTTLMKAIKNNKEIQNAKESHIKDGVAVTKFLYWLKQKAGSEELTELSVADKLEEFRKEQSCYVGPSFSPIVAYEDHGAIIHYSTTAQSNAEIKPEGLLLLDTGGQYEYGTTDITRTICFGELSYEAKAHYTAVLKGNLRLMDYKFSEGTSGVELDSVARQPVLDVGLDYNHGTGHGVGSFLCVHEGPNRISKNIPPENIEKTLQRVGMITSDEPGIYIEGEYGIRLENLLLCTNTAQGLGFEPLTMVPFDRDAILPELMADEEKNILNSYHRTVRENISRYLGEDEAQWLFDATQSI